MAISRLSPQEVSDAPELLALASLDTNLWTLQIALIAAFPELIDEWARQTDGPALRAAQRLFRAAATLQRAITRYRKVLQAERSPPPTSHDLPF
jgi:hypothetical protein